VLELYPDEEEAYRTASGLYHDVLFQFPEALALNQHWLERHPDDLSAPSDFAEKHFTIGRFAEYMQRIGALVENPTVEAKCFQQEVAVFVVCSRSKANSLNHLAYRGTAKSIRKHIASK
jgi:hypothetical protein